MTLFDHDKLLRQLRRMGAETIEVKLDGVAGAPMTRWGIVTRGFVASATPMGRGAGVDPGVTLTVVNDVDLGIATHLAACGRSTVTLRRRAAPPTPGSSHTHADGLPQTPTTYTLAKIISEDAGVAVYLLK